MEPNNSDGQQPGFIDSHAFFAAILMAMFAIAIAFALIGFTNPSWLGFS